MSKQLPLPEVEWRDIPGFEGIYQVSNTGHIRRINPIIRDFKTKPNQTGYVIVHLSKNGKVSFLHTHRLVMQAFVGECPPKIQVNHKNGIRHDNRLENLEYCTQSENLRHAKYVLGKSFGYGSEKSPAYVRGEAHGLATLTTEKVISIRELAATGMMQKDIARLYGVKQQCISKIVNRKRWSHVE